MSLMSRVVGARLFRRNKELRRTAVWCGEETIHIYDDNGVEVGTHALSPDAATDEKVYNTLDRYADKGVFET